MSSKDQRSLQELYEQEGPGAWPREARTPGLADRFVHHPPDEPTAVVHAMARRAVWECAEVLDGIVPTGREKSLMLTHLETALFFASAAIARSAAPSHHPEA